MAFESWVLFHRAIVRGPDALDHPVTAGRRQSPAYHVAKCRYARGGVESVRAVGELDLLAETGAQVHLLEQVLACHAVETHHPKCKRSEGVRPGETGKAEAGHPEGAGRSRGATKGGPRERAETQWVRPGEVERGRGG